MPAFPTSHAVRPGRVSTWLLVFAAFACLGILACGGGVALLAVIGYQSQASLATADKLYPTDKRKAAAIYKQVYPGAGGRKGQILVRIIDHEANDGDPRVAEEWAEKGLREGLSPECETPSGRLAVKAARRVIDHERAVAENEKFQAQFNRPSQKPTTAGNTVDANRALGRDAFRALLIGRRKDELVGLVGKPSQTQDQQDFGEFWYYHGVSRDPITGQRYNIVQVVIEDGVVSQVNFN